MPIVHFHIVEGQTTSAQEEVLLIGASRLYAEALQCPMDRVRAFIQTYPPTRCAVAGQTVAAGGPHAPYFEFLVLEGRPLSQRQRLLSGFTDLLVDILKVDRSLVRGHCKRVQPDEWAIAGAPASKVRKADIGAFTSLDDG